MPTSERYTRQQARAEKRAIFKQLHALRKKDAMKRRALGGAVAASSEAGFGVGMDEQIEKGER